MYFFQIAHTSCLNLNVEHHSPNSLTIHGYLQSQIRCRDSNKCHRHVNKERCHPLRAVRGHALSTVNPLNRGSSEGGFTS